MASLFLASARPDSGAATRVFTPLTLIFTVAMPKNDSTRKLKESLWQLVAAIPPGQVATYGQLARLAGYPNHARYVGTTLNHLPKGTALCWFRVLRSSGELAFPPDSAQWKRQKGLLEAEGVIFKGMKVPLKQYQWQV